MNKIVTALALGLGPLTVAGAPPAQAQASASPDYQAPDFTGRDRAYSYLRTRILEGMHEGVNFNGHYTIVRIGCGSGCSNNLLVNRRTGQIHPIPFGGEEQQMLTLRHSVRSDMLTAVWTDYEACYLQQVRWNGAGFEVRSSPRVVSEELCRS
ncbi:hypothetical protein [Qipengyuania sp.]|uniref:hypothetical protein n=1 Tax=Qipengyuania sp. TaxID=2004515 RepID=UPI0035C7DFE4